MQPGVNNPRLKMKPKTKRKPATNKTAGNKPGCASAIGLSVWSEYKPPTKMKKRKSKDKQVHDPLFLYGHGGLISMSFSSKEVATAEEIGRRIGNGEKVQDSAKTLLRTIAYWCSKAQTAQMETMQWSFERTRIVEAFQTLTRLAHGERLALT